MDWLHALAKDDDDNDNPYRDAIGANGATRDTIIQLILSASLGLIAFLAFCILRPRWTSLYAARKKQKDAATVLPELPATLFGWMPVLWKITDQQILASAGLDAYVFLDFFKLAAQFFSITLFFSLAVIKPVHDANPEAAPTTGNKTEHHGNKTQPDGGALLWERAKKGGGYIPPEYYETDYLWMYIVFTYLFTGIAIYLLIAHTRKVIQIRQEYLGTQSTVTDRTIRLSGIPKYLQDEEKIKDFIEKLDIGKVESVTICRNWAELDTAMRERMKTLRKLELAYAIFASQQAAIASQPNISVLPPTPVDGDVEAQEQGDGEDAALIETNGNAHKIAVLPELRPKVTIRFGTLNLQSRKVDAIDYYTERLRRLDDRIKELRQSQFETTPLAFVTMDSVAASQMAVQAVLDPTPLQLVANYSPPPSEVIWTNTYQARRSRMIKSWSVTALIILLTIFWSALMVPVISLVNVDTIAEAFPQLSKLLEDHANIRSLIKTQLPVLIVTLLTVTVPYLYYWLSWYQGFISVGEIELSSISKNFFFTFFNFFLLFTVFSTAADVFDFVKSHHEFDSIRRILWELAKSLAKMIGFYTNFIILQSLTMHPVRLLELGSVALYPIFLMGAKTPRDYAELVQPPIFSYGFYLPTALLIFIVCIVYSVLRDSWAVLLAGLAYFSMGHFVYKYQLLYAMDHSPHSTGRAWGMISDRVFLGIIFFQFTTAAQLIFKNAIARTATMIPLIAATIWCSIVFGRTYKPLLKFIALQNIKQAQQDDYISPDGQLPASAVPTQDVEQNVWADVEEEHWRYYRESRASSPSRHQELTRFVNPSLVSPLHGVWVANREFANGLLNGETEEEEQEEV